MLNNEHESTESTESHEQFFQKSQATERISRIFLLLPNTDFGWQFCQMLDSPIRVIRATFRWI